MSYRFVERQVIYDGDRVRLEVHHLENEETGKHTHREVCVHPGAVVVLGFLPDGRVLLIRNRRYAVGQYLVELPAGTLGKNEDPMNCAGRELAEETGYLAGRLKLIGAFFTSPGILSEKMYAYAAYDLRPTRVAPDEGEEIEVTPAPFEAAVQMVRDGLIEDAKTIAALLMYEQFHRAAAASAAAAP